MSAGLQAITDALTAVESGQVPVPAGDLAAAVMELVALSDADRRLERLALAGALVAMMIDRRAPEPGSPPRYPHVHVVLGPADNPAVSCGATPRVLRAAGITDPLTIGDFLHAARAGDYRDAEKVIAEWVTVTGRDAG